MAAPTPIDGVWRVTTTADELLAAGDPESMAENYGSWTYVFAGGRFAFTQESEDACTWAYGTYTVDGDRVEWEFIDGGGIAPNNAANKPGEFFVFEWSRYRDTLTLAAAPGEVSPTNFMVEPWRLTDERTLARRVRIALPTSCRGDRGLDRRSGSGHVDRRDVGDLADPRRARRRRCQRRRDC